MPRAAIFKPPRLRPGPGAEEKERSASWLELFFDLVFVVAIAQLALVLSDDPSLAGLGRFVLLFAPIWWAWLGYTVYADRFDADDVAFRVLMLAGMLAVAGLAVAVPEAFVGGSLPFALCYIANRLVLIFMYLRVSRSVPEARRVARFLNGAYAGGTALWLVSLLFPEPVRFIFWAAAILLEASIPLAFRRVMVSVPFHATHLPERFGLFTIIVLGESLVAVVIGLGDVDWGLRTGWIAVAGFLAAGALWWVYFDCFEGVDISGGPIPRTFIYGHLPIAVGLTGLGVGV